MEKPETCVQTRSESDIVTQHHTASSSVLGKGGVLLIPSPPPTGIWDGHQLGEDSRRA